MIGIKNQQFGVEIEFTGITRREAATALADYFHTAAVYMGGGVRRLGRFRSHRTAVEEFMSDGSIRGEQKVDDHCYIRTGDRSYQVEFVTPVLHYEDMDSIPGCHSAPCATQAGKPTIPAGSMSMWIPPTTTARASKTSCPSCTPRRIFCSKPCRSTRPGSGPLVPEGPGAHAAARPGQLPAEETKDLTQTGGHLV